MIFVVEEAVSIPTISANTKPFLPEMGIYVYMALTVFAFKTHYPKGSTLAY